jgi:hypothetical protein
MLAFPTVGWADDDVVPVCVVDTLLGGGASFSAGGPGKGMYSRLYREVLNTCSWVESVNAFSTQLYDRGLVGIYGSAPPENAGELAALMAAHLVRLVDEPVHVSELVRARNQLASSVLMNLETRGLLCEDIGRQILSHGKRMDPPELCRRIQAVTPADLMRVMRTALLQPPSFAAVGDLSTLPDYASMHAFFTQRMAAYAPASRVLARAAVGLGGSVTAGGSGAVSVAQSAFHSAGGGVGVGVGGGPGGIAGGGSTPAGARGYSSTARGPGRGSSTSLRGQ